MLFKKRKIDFSEQSAFSQLENALQKYVAPELQQLGFKMTIDLEYYWIYFKRKYGDFIHEIRIVLSDDSKSPGKALFHSDWSIYSQEYEKWHLEQFGEMDGVPEVASWDDHSNEKLDDKYRKISIGGYYKEYDLGKYTTEKLMNHFLKQTLDVRIPLLEKYSDWKLLAEWSMKELDHMGVDKIVDCFLMAKDYNSAGNILKQAEDYLKVNPEEYEFRAKKIAERKNYLRYNS